MTGDFESKLVEDVEARGFSSVWVFDDEEGLPDFAYTVGLSFSCRHPELVVVGLPYRASVGILHEAAGRAVEGTELRVGDRVQDVALGFDVLIGSVDRGFMEANMRQAAGFAGGSSRGARQILWPDRRGIFPGEPGFDSRLAGRQDLR
ncbi:DUF4262 domain-containing protein [Myceligenerans xiligouense]|uniref:Uncharacterized protein DUF4262 n=1 Tax=Myceligenerans xiligouense TaxID=253184 RepID=A0A3N4YHU6_9MICO|nr:DUF4262 domain-containing protein [Myceligenerans xiligouense]RPF20343.1 uncharacterized protein DUF4262 [Myceligenerans xiligouense]